MQEPLEHSGMWPLDECQESPLLSWCPLTDWCARQNLLIISYLCGQVQCGQAPRPIPLSYPFVCVTYRSLTPRDQFLVLYIRASGGSRCPVKYLGQDISNRRSWLEPRTDFLSYSSALEPDTLQLKGGIGEFYLEFITYQVLYTCYLAPAPGSACYQPHLTS